MSLSEVSVHTVDAVREYHAFIDYFQMGETTSRRCLSFLTRGLICCDALANIYLRNRTISDSRNIVALHQDAHKIPDFLVSLDVTEVHWKNCPTAWKGQFHGHEKYYVMV